MKGVLFAVTLLCAFAGRLRSDEVKAVVSGQVFVVTRGGDNIKLGDVEVAAYDLTATRDLVEKREADSKKLSESLVPLLRATGDAKRAANAERESKMQAAFERHDYSLEDAAYKRAVEMAEKVTALDWDARWGSIYSLSALYFFEKLHDPVVKSRTDADGKYSLLLPHGKFALAARSNRKIADSEETYCWVVLVEVESSPVSLNLANVNMASSGNSSSLIQTVNPEDEALAAVGKEGLVKLLQFRDEQNAKEAAARKQADELSAARKSEFIRLHFSDLVKASQARALRNHPDLSVASSSFNQKFVAAYKELQAKNDPVLQDPCWPERLAGDNPPPLIQLESPVLAPNSQDVAPSATPLAAWRTPHPPYPAQARMSHVTGLTTVRFTTDASGNVSSVVIVKSAGSAILDSNTQGYVKMNWKGPPNSTHETDFEYRLQ